MEIKMNRSSCRKVLAVILVAMLTVSAMICGTVTPAVAVEVGETISYSYVVKCDPASSFEGVVYYPSDSLTVQKVTVYDGKTGSTHYSDKVGKIMFNGTDTANSYDFSQEKAIITVQFLVNGDYNNKDITTEITDLCDDANLYTGINIPYHYKNIIDDKVITSGYVEIDNPDNNYTDPTDPVIEEKTVYFVNSGEWDTVNAYLFNTDQSIKNTEWPGENMVNTSDKTSSGVSIYSLTYDANAGYEFVIFNNKENGDQQTIKLDLTPNAGKYYDWKTQKWYDDPDDIKYADKDLVTNCYLAGDFNEWNELSNEFMKKSSSDDVCYVSLELDANRTYEFRIIRNGKWLSNTNTITSENCSDLTFSTDNKDKCIITTTQAGTYEFAFNISTSKLSVAYPIPQKITYSVVYNYNDGTEDSVLTKTVTTTETDPMIIASTAMPSIKNPYYTYYVGSAALDGTSVTVTLKGIDKTYDVTLDGKEIGSYKYKDIATVTSDEKTGFVVNGKVVAVGTEFTFYVTGDTSITTDPSVAETDDNATLSLNGLTVSDTKITMELLATANVSKFSRMGVAFSTSQQSLENITAAINDVTTGTGVSNDIAVHNSDVNAANLSGQYQFVYAPFVSSDKATATIYFYAFVVRDDGTVLISEYQDVNLANAIA